MSRENLRDHLPGAGKRPRRGDPVEPVQFYQADHCELRNCHCGGRGKPDIAIQGKDKLPLGYVCQRGYKDHIDARGLNQHATFKQTGAALTTHQHTFEDDSKAKHFASIVTELDRYADSIHDQEDAYD